MLPDVPPLINSAPIVLACTMPSTLVLPEVLAPMVVLLAVRISVERATVSSFVLLTKVANVSVAISICVTVLDIIFYLLS